MIKDYFFLLKPEKNIAIVLLGFFNTIYVCKYEKVTKINFIIVLSLYLCWYV